MVAVRSSLLLALIPVLPACSLVFPSDGYTSDAESFDEVCATADVIRCFGFDGQAELDALYLPESCVLSEVVDNCYGTIDQTVKDSGEGSLRIRVPMDPDPNGINDVAAFQINFTPDSTNAPNDQDYPAQIGVGERLFVSWQMRISGAISNLGSYEVIGVGRGDRRGFSPSMDDELTVRALAPSNAPQLFATLFGGMGCVTTALTAMDGVGRVLVQNAVSCSADLSDPGCVFMTSDEWVRYEIGLDVGNWNAAESRLRLWVQKPEQPVVKVVDQTVPLCEPTLLDPTPSYGKMWFSPRPPNRPSIPEDGFIWYDSLVISRVPTIGEL